MLFLQVHGCAPHACPKCIGANTVGFFLNGDRPEVRFRKTEERDKAIAALPNIELRTIWEHDVIKVYSRCINAFVNK